MDSERERRIRELAYELWEQAGKPDGGAEEYWYEAERRLRDESSQGLREEPAGFETAAPGDEPEAPEPSDDEPTRSARASKRMAAR
jgi:hypothetical protein